MASELQTETARHRGETPVTMPPTMTAPPAATETGTRLFFVDNLRVALTVLVVVHHLAITYSGVAPWYIIDGGDGSAFVPMLLLVLFNQAFFMGAFFLIAAYFTPGAYDRKGAGGFLRDRLLRLGLPLFVYWVVIGPLTAFGGYDLFTQYLNNGVPLPPGAFYLRNLGPGPLWFLEALLLFAVAYALWRGLTRGRAATTSDGNPPAARAVVAFTLALAVVTFLWRIAVPVGWSLPVLAFPTVGHLPQYIGLFVVGVIAYRRGWFGSLPAAWGKVAFGAVVAATTLLFPVALSGATTGTPTFLGGGHWASFVFALWEAIVGVGMIVGLLTLFRVRFNRQGRLGGFLAAHAYAVYIIHAPVIVGVAYALQGVPLPPLAKFAVAVFVGVPLCFAVAALVRKLPLARRIL